MTNHGLAHENLIQMRINSISKLIYHQANTTVVQLSNELSQMKNGILGSVNALTTARDNLIQKRNSTQNDPNPYDLSTFTQPTNTQASAVINIENFYDIVDKM